MSVIIHLSLSFSNSLCALSLAQISLRKLLLSQISSFFLVSELSSEMPQQGQQKIVHKDKWDEGK